MMCTRMSRKNSSIGKTLRTKSQLTIGKTTSATVGVPRFMYPCTYDPCVDRYITGTSEHTSTILKMSLCSMGMNGGKCSKFISIKGKNLLSIAWWPVVCFPIFARLAFPLKLGSGTPFDSSWIRIRAF